MIELTALSFTLTFGFAVAFGLFLGIHLESMSRASFLEKERTERESEASDDPYEKGGD